MDLQITDEFTGAVGLECDILYFYISTKVPNKVSWLCLFSSLVYQEALTLPVISLIWPGCDPILWCETILNVADDRYKAWLTWESTSASVNLNNSELCLNLSKNQMESCFHFTSPKMQPANSSVSQTKDKKCHQHWSDHERSLPSKLYRN